MAETEPRAAILEIDLDAYSKMEKTKMREFRRKSGLIRWVTRALAHLLSSGIAHEVRDDWQRIRQLCDVTQARLFKGGAVSADIAQQLASASAYLELARETKDLAETWSFVNQASEILCKLVDDQERQSIAERFTTWEPSLQRWLKELHDDGTVTADLKKERDAVPADDPCRKVAVHARQWQLVNLWISFTRRLWRLALLILVVTLILAIGVAEYLYDPASIAPGNKLTAFTDDPFIWISVLGLFGGALSAMLTANDRKVTAVTYGQSRSQIFIRLVLGAAGAFVVYILISMPGLFQPNVVKFVNEKLVGFLMLGIVAGFSERLFLNALERAAKKFPTSGGKSPDGS